MSTDTSHGAAARLRDDIDRGRSGDKVDWPDPAAAPLGTDDEAAGKTAPERSIENERAKKHSYPAAITRREQGPGAAWILIVFSLILGAVLLGGMYIVLERPE